MKKLGTNKIINIILGLLTVIRIYIQNKMPLYLQAGAGFDDFLLVSYAKNIMTGKYLGTFSTRTLAKGISYPIFLIINYISGIPYSVFLILFYIIAIILFIKVIKKYIQNKYYLYAIYISLLYSPVMFHIENVQKIYRGGAIVVFALIVIASIIGIYNNKNERLKKLLLYSIIASLALPFFYYLKEDSIWIMPFVLGATTLSIIYLIRNKIKDKFKRIILVILPIITLLITNYSYCTINYLYYNEFTITDRSGTYFKEVIKDLIRIEEKEEKDNIWISKNMMYKAVNASKTLGSIKPYIDDMYENSFALKNGEIEGDMIFWTIKEAVGEAHIYDKGGKKLNNFYKKIDKELKEAFENKTLKKESDKKIYISTVARGFTIDELIDYYPKVTPKALKMLITYSENETSVNNAYGNYEDIVFMDTITNSTTVWPNEMTNFYKPYTLIVKISQLIVSIYQKTGYIVFILGVIGLIIFTVKTIKDIIKKNYKHLDLFLILFGILVTISILLFGVEWFTSWCGGSIYRHIYNYTCGLIPLMQILEITGIYFLIKEIRQFINTKRRSK